MKNAIQSGADTFDLATITDFEWDSLQFTKKQLNIWTDGKTRSFGM
jgi:hypothetical protein